MFIDDEFKQLKADLNSIAVMLNDLYYELYIVLHKAIGDGMHFVFMSPLINLFIKDLQLKGPNIATCILEMFMLDGKSVTQSIFIFAFMKLEQKLLEMDEDDVYKYLQDKMILDLVEKCPMHLILAQNSLPKWSQCERL